MIIYPAIDLKEGVCVRLKMGDMKKVTQYGDPADVACRWQSQGAEYLHVVDLDAAFCGEFSNKQAVMAIIEAVGIPIQLGGGVRSLQDIEQRLSIGVQRVILGTAAVENMKVLERAVKQFPGQIAVGIDAKNGRAATHGWVKTTHYSPVELALKVKGLGVDTIIYTDITKDGMLGGPNVNSTKDLVQKTGMQIIASGGMSSAADVAHIKQTGAQGVIIGKALYTGDIDLRQAIRSGRA